MMKLLLADDEALSLVGLRSMLPWEEYGIEICATAHNGEEALAAIDRFYPEIVITDIKMPILSGLDVLEESRKRYGNLPVFIILTSYEEFDFAKKALGLGAVEYLVKLEITQQSLAEAVNKAKARVEACRLTCCLPEKNSPNLSANLQSCTDAFFSRLYFYYFQSRKDFVAQSTNLGLTFPGKYFCVASLEIANREKMPASRHTEAPFSLFTSVTQLVQESCQKCYTCYMTNLDVRHFNVLFCLDAWDNQVVSRLCQVLEATIADVRGYCGVELLCAIGSPVTDAFLVRRSYRSACALIPTLTAHHPIAVDDGSVKVQKHLQFNFSAYKETLTKAFQELDQNTVYKTINQMSATFEGKPSAYMQAMSAAIGLLHMSMSLLPDGEKTVEAIFADLPDNYHSLYMQTTTEQYCKWIDQIRDGICEDMRQRKQNKKKKLIKDVESYIRNNLDKRLLITDVARVFNFSPNYLSQMFSQYSDCSYTDFVTREKIAAAKVMMVNSDRKIYEISELLGFNSAYYFSKVFKKSTGMSPRQYLQSQNLPDDGEEE